MKTLVRSLSWLTAFCIAMTFLESAVVVYLRELLYPKGFLLPMTPMKAILVSTEVIRELATMIMLILLGFILGKNFMQRLAFFIYGFAVWDIFYYIFLKLILDWPESLLSWDILFLIPSPWYGPVICPLIISIEMISIALAILFAGLRLSNNKFRGITIISLVIGCLITILAFTSDFLLYCHRLYVSKIITPIGLSDFLQKCSYHYIPQQFDWPLYILGQLFILTGCVSYFAYIFKHSKS
jgi:hypothetical protein